jgi:hypothetical protein
MFNKSQVASRKSQVKSSLLATCDREKRDLLMFEVLQLDNNGGYEWSSPENEF